MNSESHRSIKGRKYRAKKKLRLLKEEQEEVKDDENSQAYLRRSLRNAKILDPRHQEHRKASLLRMRLPHNKF